MRLGVNPDRGPMEPLPEGITCWGFQARQHPCPRPCSHSLSAGWVALMCLATQSKQQDHSPGWGGGHGPILGSLVPPPFSHLPGLAVGDCSSCLLFLQPLRSPRQDPMAGGLQSSLEPRKRVSGQYEAQTSGGRGQGSEQGSAEALRSCPFHLCSPLPGGHAALPTLLPRVSGPFSRKPDRPIKAHICSQVAREKLGLVCACARWAVGWGCRLPWEDPASAATSPSLPSFSFTRVMPSGLAQTWTRQEAPSPPGMQPQSWPGVGAVSPGRRALQDITRGRPLCWLPPAQS